jgi:signal transduction histidine kinase
VRGDRDLLLEAVANLVDNAIKFTPRRRQRQARAAARRGETILRVTDTGPGISDQEQEAVLRRFYRSDKIRNTPGVGLGLNLVSAIVKLHGFRLIIHSGPGAGWRSFAPMSPSAGHEVGEPAGKVIHAGGRRVVDSAMPDSGAGHAAIPFIIGLHHRGRHPFHPVGRRRRAAIQDVQIRIVECKGSGS